MICYSTNVKTKVCGSLPEANKRTVNGMETTGPILISVRVPRFFTELDPGILTRMTFQEIRLPSVCISYCARPHIYGKNNLASNKITESGYQRISFRLLMELTLPRIDRLAELSFLIFFVYLTFSLMAQRGRNCVGGLPLPGIMCRIPPLGSATSFFLLGIKCI